MVDQCDNCSFYRTRAYGSSHVGECRFKDPFIQGQLGAWAVVKPDDWCAEYESIGFASRYLSGALTLTDITRKKLYDVGGDKLYTAATMTGCQLSNPTGQLKIFTFYDGDTTTILTRIGCAQNTSYQFQFSPAPVVALSGAIYVGLDSTSVGVTVSAQGFKARPG